MRDIVAIKCKMCGGELSFNEGSTVAECEYCGSRQTIPNQDNEKKITLFARADRLRRACEFDKSAGIYESIVAEFPEESEAYWGLVLCRYGIEYVDDPATGKKVPTCHRSSFDSILEDADFDQACENADPIARRLYRDEAKVIESIRRGILEVSAQEEPYDIFICYKETDESGGRTIDSVIAQDVYDVLTGKGYRVFFSRISLEDKLGSEYEPYIFAALNSAKIMLVFGTDFEYFNAVWVKNEWSRFLALIASGREKTLIPCYKGVDAYDMPKEFQRLQAQDMGKVGAIQDLLRGVEKIIAPSNAQMVAGIASLVDRGNMALEEQDWSEAEVLFEKALDADSRCAEAYFGLVLADQEIYGWEAFEQKYRNSPLDLNDNKNLQRARRFAKGELRERFDLLDQKMGMSEVQISKTWKQEEDALIVKAEELVGEHGPIMAVESKTVNTKIDILPGMLLNCGLVSPYFVTDTDTMVASYDDALVFLTNYGINNIQDILPLLEHVVQDNRNLVIFAKTIEGNALSTLLVNHLRGTLKVACIDLEEFNDHLMDMLQDLAVLTGGQVISEELGYDIKKTDISMLGRCRRIRAESYRCRTEKCFTTIVCNADREQVVQSHVEGLRAQLEGEKERQWIEERIKRLSSGLAMIRLTGSSDAENRARLRHMDTALEARVNRLYDITPFTDEELSEKEWIIREQLVEKAIEKAYPTRFISTEESKTHHSDVYACAGLKLDQGFLSPHLVSDTEKMESVMDDALLFIADQRISTIEQVLPVLEQIMQSGRRIVIIVEDISDEVLDTLIVNHQRDTLHVQCVSVAGLGPHCREIMEDLAIVTGGSLISSPLESMNGDEQFACLGKARTVTVTRTSTEIVDGNGDWNRVEERIWQLREEILRTSDDGYRKELHERMERLCCGAVVISVGGDTVSSMKERKRGIEERLTERLKQSEASSAEELAEQRRQRELQWAEDIRQRKAEEEEVERRRIQEEENARRQAELEMQRQRDETERVRRENAATAERVRAEAERQKIKSNLVTERTNLHMELVSLKGLFSRPRRKEIEYRLQKIEEALKNL